VTVYAETTVLTGELTNFNVSIVDEGYKITFENTYKDLNAIKVYINELLLLTAKGDATEVIVPVTNKSVGLIIKIEGLIATDAPSYLPEGQETNWAVVTTKEVNYYSPIDFNCDGKEDKADLDALAQFILENALSSETNELAYYYDVNNDGKLDVKDIIYVSMYLNNELASPKLKQFKVTFIDATGRVLEVQEVKAFEDASIANPSLEGYTFIGWDKDFTNITSDIVVKAIYSKN